MSHSADNTPVNTVSALSVKLNFVLIGCMLAAAVYYICGLSIVTSALSLTAAVLAFGIYQQQRWAYFSCAAACFGAFWLARMDQGFIGDKHIVMSLSLPLMIFALYLHEKIVPKTASEIEPEVDSRDV